MTGYPVLLRKEMLELWRTMRLGVVLIVYVAFGLLSVLTARYLPELIGSMLPADQVTLQLATPTLADAVAQFVKNVGGTLTVAAVLLAMGMIASEKERGTAAFILTRPAGRGAFVAAKLCALALTLAAALAASGAVTFAYSAWLFETPPVGGFAAMVALVWLAQLVIAAITLLASALMRSAVAAGAIGFAAYVMLAMLSVLPAAAPLTPAGLQNAAAEVALEAIPGLPWPSIVVNAAIVIGCGLLAWVALRRQEL